MTDSQSRTALATAGEAHALKIGGYGVHCACGYYFEGFGPNPRTQRSCVRDYGWADETLFEHVARSLPAGVGGDREALLNRQIDEFMGWLFRDGGLEPPRREYDLVDQRLRTFLLSAALSRPDALVEAALTSEDEIAHGEGWDDVRKRGLGVCAYCDDEWPCRTQRGIDRLRAALADHP